jgi:hypothetical protein
MLWKNYFRHKIGGEKSLGSSMRAMHLNAISARDI